MKLKLVKSDNLDNWYTIERAEHSGAVWLEEVESGSETFKCSKYMMACRVSDADVEGTLEQMYEIACAIKGHSSFSAKRCAAKVDLKSRTVEFWSPRNSQEAGTATLEEAYELADQIFIEYALDIVRRC